MQPGRRAHQPGLHRATEPLEARANLSTFGVPDASVLRSRCLLVASHIVLREANLPFKLDRIDLKAGKKIAGGESYFALNPKGYVPALELDDGSCSPRAR